MHLNSPRRGWRLMLSSRLISSGLIFGIICNIVQWAYITLRVRPQEDPIPLHYNITFGIDKIGPWYFAFQIPFSGTIITVVNIMLTTMVIEHQRATASLIALLSFFIQLTFLSGALLSFGTL